MQGIFLGSVWNALEEKTVENIKAIKSQLGTLIVNISFMNIVILMWKTEKLSSVLCK